MPYGCAGGDGTEPRRSEAAAQGRAAPSPHGAGAAAILAPARSPFPLFRREKRGPAGASAGGERGAARMRSARRRARELPREAGAHARCPTGAGFWRRASLSPEAPREVSREAARGRAVQLPQGRLSRSRRARAALAPSLPPSFPPLLPSSLSQRRRHVPLPAAPQHLALRAERGRRHPVSGGGAGARAGFGGLARPRARGSLRGRGREGSEPGPLCSPLSLLPALPSIFLAMLLAPRLSTRIRFQTASRKNKAGPQQSESPAAAFECVQRDAPPRRCWSLGCSSASAILLLDGKK